MTDLLALEDLLERWEDERERGRDVPALELCRDHPALTERVEAELRLLRRMDWLDRSFQETTDGQWSIPNETIGSILSGRYRLVRPLGRGGFGIVWLATDVRLQRSVALKLPHTGSLFRSGDQSAKKEYDLMVGLLHPNILPVYAVGEHRENSYIVSHFVEGGTLAQAIRRGRMDAPKAVRIVRDIAKAVHRLHMRGIIHRDLKPANMLIDEAGRAFLTDFGIAIYTTPWTTVVPPTAAGTIAYMAPEQLRLDFPIDHRCDQYALGIVLFELLTGYRPFAGRNISEVAARLIERERPAALPEYVEISEDLDLIVQRCLADLPDNRYDRVADLITVLNRALERLDGRYPLLAEAGPFEIPHFWPTPAGGFEQHEPRDSTVTSLGGPIEARVGDQPLKSSQLHGVDHLGQRHALVQELQGAGSFRGQAKHEDETGTRSVVFRAAAAVIIVTLLIVVMLPVMGSDDPRLGVLIVVASCVEIGLLVVGRRRLALLAILVVIVAFALWLSRWPFTLWEEISSVIGRALGAK